MPTEQLPWYAKLVLKVGTPASVITALIMAIPGETSMARQAGWSDNYSAAMPICISIYAACAAVIANTKRKQRSPGWRGAFVGALLALGLALSAQAIAHLIAQHYMFWSAGLTVGVSCIPPLVVAHMLHMASTPADSNPVPVREEEGTTNGFSFFDQDQTPEDDPEPWTDEPYEVPQQPAMVPPVLVAANTVAEEIPGQMSIYDTVDEPAAPRRPGRPAPDMRRIAAAAERISSSGQMITGHSLAKALGVSVRTGYRYLDSLRTHQVA